MRPFLHCLGVEGEEKVGGNWLGCSLVLTGSDLLLPLSSSSDGTIHCLGVLCIRASRFEFSHLPPFLDKEARASLTQDRVR